MLFTIAANIQMRGAVVESLSRNEDGYKGFQFVFSSLFLWWEIEKSGSKLKTVMVIHKVDNYLPLYEELNKKERIIIYALKGTEFVRFQNKIPVFYFEQKFAIKILEKIIKDKPDIFHIQFEFHTFGSFYASCILLSFLTFLIKIFSKAKIVVTLHSALPRHLLNKTFLQDIGFKKLSVVGFPVKMFFTFLYSSVGLFSDAIIAHGNFIKEWLVSDYKIDPKKIHVIHHGINVGELVDNNLSLSYWGEKIGNNKLVLCFGVLSPRKGLEYLVEAYANATAKYKDVILAVTGKESYSKGYKKSLIELVNKLGIQDKVVFTGYLNNEDVDTLFRLASIVVLPYTYSISYSGPLCLVYKYGKPLIATNIGCFKEELNDEMLAILVPPKNIPKLSSALEKLIADEYLRKNLSENIQRKTKGRSWEEIGTEHWELYRKLIAEES